MTGKVYTMESAEYNKQIDAVKQRLVVKNEDKKEILKKR